MGDPPRRRLPEWLIPAAFLGIGMGGMLLSGRGSGEAPTMLPPGKRQDPPSLRLTDLDGRPWNLSDHRGRVVLVNYWATWCGPCRQETPDLVTLDRDLRPRGLDVVGIAADDGGASVVRPFVRAYGIGYPVALGKPPTPSDPLVPTALPTTLLIDRRGKVAGAVVGRADDRALRSAVEGLLKEQ